MPIDPNHSALIHATKRALWYLSGKHGKRPPASKVACQKGVVILTREGIVGAQDVLRFLEGEHTPSIPTCPKCAVLWDEAVALRASQVLPAEAST